MFSQFVPQVAINKKINIFAEVTPRHSYIDEFLLICDIESRKIISISKIFENKFERN